MKGNWYWWLTISFFLVDVIIWIFFFWLYRKYKQDDNSLDLYQERYEESLDVLQNSFGNNISIIAPIRKGKNVLFNQFMYALESGFKDKIEKEISDFETDFYWIDLVFLKRTIDSRFREIIKNTYDEDFYPDGYISVKDRLELTDYCMRLCCQRDGIFNDFINNIPIKKRFYTYVDDIYILNYRGFNVVSRTAVYSWVNNRFSKILDDDTIQIKCVKDTHNFYLERYMIVFEDEKSLERGMQYSFNNDLKDKGVKELKCIFGNAFGSTSYWFTLKQLAKDDVSNERNLSTNNILIKDTKTMGVLGNLLVYYRKKRSRLDSVYRKKYERKKKYDFIGTFVLKYPDYCSWINEPSSEYRKMKYFYKRIEDFINSLGYLQTTFFDYTNRIDMVGVTENEGFCKEYTITFPLYVCWGVHDTNEWSCVVDELNSMSITCAMAMQDNGFYKNNEIKKSQLKFLYERSKAKKEEKTVSEPIKKKKVEKKKNVDDNVITIDDLKVKF